MARIRIFCAIHAMRPESDSAEGADKMRIGRAATATHIARVARCDSNAEIQQIDIFFPN
jgi:hypothetical protein